MRHLARLQGVVGASNRPALQQIGQAAVTKDPQAFVSGALAWAGALDDESLVLDGIRHISVWEAIQQLASTIGQQAKLVFVDMPEEERRIRLASRGISPEEVFIQDQHASEQDVRDRLKRAADLCVEAQENQDAAIAAIVKHFGLG